MYDFKINPKRSILAPFTSWLVVLVQNDSKARAGVGSGGGWK